MTSASSASNLGALAGAAAVRREIHAALETGAFRADCQGIVSLANGDALGFEALTRPASRPPLDTPESFLTAAANEGLLAEVDHTWRVGSIARFGPGFPSERLLFLNVSPLSLLSGHTTAGALESTTRQFGLSPERVVLELTEGEKIDDFDRMRRVLGGFRSRGFLIAIDDAGAGQSSLQSVVELRPDYIKLDRWLSRDIEFDRSRRSMVQALVGFAHQVRARVVAEGIETYEQLDAFIDLGVDFGQGYIFGFPAAIPVPAPPEVQLHIRKKNTTRRRTATDPGIVRMRDLACVTPTVDATTPGDAVFWLFQENSNLDVVAVIDDEGIGGIITRGRIFERMSGQFGLPLNGRRPASELCVAATTVQASIVAAAASHIALTRPPSAQSDPLIVLDGKTYAGVVGMHELLQQLLTEEVAEARLMSPLTGLPGNRLIRRQIEAVHSSEQSLLLLYADIDNFKSFNDRFGFAHGDAAISGLATALLEAADVCTCEPFVGHVGGDDFVLLVDERDLPAFRTAVQVRLARRWFDPDRRLALDRLTVSIGGGPLAELHDRAYEDLGLVVAAAKRSLKEAGGDCFVVYPSLATFETVLERVA